MKPLAVPVEGLAIEGAGTTNADPSNPCAACDVRSRAVCAALDDTELRQVSKVTHHREMAAGEPLFFQGDAADTLQVIEKGAVKLYKLLADGRRQITGFLFKGDLIGLAFVDEETVGAEALEATRTCLIPRKQIETLAVEIPAFGRRMLAQASSDIAEAQEQMLLLGRKTAVERVASFLLWLSEKAEARGDDARLFSLPMSRTDMGDYLGLTVETVSRTMTRLRKLGVIALEDRHKVRIADRSRLAAMAEGEE